MLLVIILATKQALEEPVRCLFLALCIEEQILQRSSNFFCRKWIRIIHEMGSTRNDQNMFLFRRMKERVRGGRSSVSKYYTDQVFNFSMLRLCATGKIKGCCETG